jgi:hypothetical protein
MMQVTSRKPTYSTHPLHASSQPVEDQKALSQSKLLLPIAVILSGVSIYHGLATNAMLQQLIDLQSKQGEANLNKRLFRLKIPLC